MFSFVDTDLRTSALVDSGCQGIFFVHQLKKHSESYSNNIILAVLWTLLF